MELKKIQSSDIEKLQLLQEYKDLYEKIKECLNRRYEIEQILGI